MTISDSSKKSDVVDLKQIGGDDDVFYEGQTQESLDDWLASHKPSQSGNSGYPWFWVRRSVEEKKDSPSANHMQLTEQAYTIRQDLIERCQAIADDAEIPEVYDNIHQKLRDLAIELGVLDGKWLLYPSDDYVDEIWAKITRAIIEEDGLLHKTAVHVAKVAAGPLLDGQATRVICVYIPNSLDRDAAGEVCKVLVQDLGLSVSSFKADIYTYAGIDSKTSKDFKSTIYQVKDFIDMDSLKRQREEAKGKAERLTAAEEQKIVSQGGGFEDDSEEDDARPSKKSKANV